MKKSIVAALLAVVVLLVGLAAGYWRSPDFLGLEETAGGGDPEVSAERAEPAPAAPVEAPDAADQEASGQDAGLAGSEAPPAPQAAAPSMDANTGPGFDILRVEPDGSLVVAGRAAPDAAVRLLDGDTVIAETTAGPEGDFALTPDAALPVGEHTLRLDAGEGAQASAQTALVSVPPQGREADLLVALNEPGAPTELIVTPEATAADPETEPVGSGAASETAPAGDPQTAALVAPDTAGSPDASAETAAPSEAPREGAEAGAAETAPSDLSIAAVEIEGDSIYIAGTAAPGSAIRIYLDDVFIAEAGTAEAQEFIAQALADVSVGPHVVRADEIGANGRVLARVEVPFDRPEGTSMAALAPAAGTTPDGDDTPAEVAALRDDAAGSTSTGVGASSAGAGSPAPEQDAATPGEGSADPDAPAVIERPTASGEPGAAGPAVIEDPGASDAPDQPASQSSSTDSASTPGISTSAPPVDAAGGPAAADPVDGGRRDTDVATASSAPQPAASSTGGDVARLDAGEGSTPPPAQEPVPPVAEGPAATRQAALQPAEGRVIIRRGDTLWRISRNTYGRGARYTVIYLANGDQIRNPDLIYPGQVFRMPRDETSAN